MAPFGTASSSFWRLARSSCILMLWRRRDLGVRALAPPRQTSDRGGASASATAAAAAAAAYVFFI